MESENDSTVKTDSEESTDSSDKDMSGSSDVELIEEISCQSKKPVDSIGMCSDFDIIWHRFKN